jgi:hypothetical protein
LPALRNGRQSLKRLTASRKMSRRVSKLSLTLSRKSGTRSQVQDEARDRLKASTSTLIAKTMRLMKMARLSVTMRRSRQISRVSRVSQATSLLKRYSVCSFVYPSLFSSANVLFTEDLKKAWHSPIYSFFRPDVVIQHHKGHLCHFFKCATPKCKTPLGGVRHFQDSKDHSSTANLKHHAKRCFGDEAMKNSEGLGDEQSGSIFAAFSRQMRLPSRPSYHVHTDQEVRYVYYLSFIFNLTDTMLSSVHVVRWIVGSCRTLHIINDIALRELLTAGRPNINLPSASTIARDIKRV